MKFLRATQPYNSIYKRDLDIRRVLDGNIVLSPPPTTTTVL